MNPKKRTIGNLILLLCAAVFLLSGGMLVHSYLLSAKEQSEFHLLSAQLKRTASVPSAVPTPYAESVEPTVEPAAATTGEPAAEPTAEPTPEAPPEILPQYAQLYAENKDLGGWVRIDGTVLDYPVMFTPEAPERYLHRAFNGSKSFSGVPFVGEGSSLWPRSDNLILYGHHMQKGTMFATIVKYKSESFWRKHPTIYFSTLYDEGEYEIFAVFQTDIYHDSALRCYDFIDAKDEADFDDYIARVRRASLYKTGVDVHYGDQLVTLSTCAYHTEDGRFVIVARKATGDNDR